MKANALYRDGSKLSQPLSTSSNDVYSKLFDFDDVDESVGPKEVSNVIKNVVRKPVRVKLPDERSSITHKFSISGHEGYLTVGLYDDGAPGEIFIRMSKEGSTLSGIMDALALSMSMNLQYGVPLEVIVGKFTHSRFEPSGMTGNRDIPMVKSIIDYIGRWLALKFLPKDIAKKYHNGDLIDRAYEEGTSLLLTQLPLEFSEEDARDHRHLERNGFSSVEVEVKKPVLVGKVENTVSVESVNELGDFAKMQQNKALQLNNEDAPICSSCGSVMVRNGSCYKCLDCGETSGCS